ncbi:hypothetical protein VTN02DRAFT_5356 [Thermoascus thermophilus]
MKSLIWLMALRAVVAKDMDRITYLFTFGNSYTTTGFNSSSTQPSAANPMGNPSLGQGTLAGGPNWVGYLTAVFNASLVFDYNLAVSGATINNSLVGGAARDLVYQVGSDFDAHYASKPVAAPWSSDDAVFAFWIGINDVGNSYRTKDPDVMVPELMDSYFGLVDELYGSGARRFLFLNVPPTTRSPMIVAQNATGAHSTYVGMYNRELSARIARFRATYPQVTAVEYDAWGFMTKVLDDPAQYGFTNATCVGSGCVWWDSYHPTSAFHRLMAQDMVPYVSVFDAW